MKLSKERDPLNDYSADLKLYVYRYYVYFIWTSWLFIIYYPVCSLSITFQYIKKKSDLKICCKVCENKLLFV